MRRLYCGLLILSATLVSAEDIDPVIGTWVLDVSKSSFDPGPPLRSQTRTYTNTSGGIAFTLTGTSAAGAPMHVGYVARYDGKDYPLKGSPSVDSVTLTRIDRFTVEAIEKKGGRPMFHVKRLIARDGTTMTITSVGTNAEGIAVRNVLVFERQPLKEPASPAARQR